MTPIILAIATWVMIVPGGAPVYFASLDACMAAAKQLATPLVRPPFCVPTGAGEPPSEAKATRK